MTTNIPPDDRNMTWPEIEADVQARAPQKDSSFVLSGPWKKYKEEKFRVLRFFSVGWRVGQDKLKYYLWSRRAWICA